MTMKDMTQAQRMDPNSLPYPILVTGAARSGVSMTAGILRRCGAWVGVVDDSYENVEIRDRVMSPYLKFLNCDPNCQCPLPTMEQLTDKPLVGLVRRVETAAKFQGFRFGPWMYKSSAIALTWPIWNQAFPDSKWVLVRRDDKDVTNSCSKTGFMRGRVGEQGWRDWLDFFKMRFEQIEGEVKEVREVWPSRYVDGDFGEVKEVVEWLGLKWNEEKVKEWVKPNLWRNADVS